jgi:glyoxylase-like metal-dependent hydrolase (beta-lactamase superfamily II)/rhodanese-related sulfurtransferase
MLEIVPIETPSLGDRSYLAHDGEVAVVIDPQRDVDRVLGLADRLGVVLAHVFETHIHNDYVTGGRALATATGAHYHVGADDPVQFAREPIADGDVVTASPTMAVQAIATPGHTFTHLSYLVSDADTPVGVFTGGSLLFGSTGRPDLLGPAATPDLVRAQFRSARRLARELPAALSVFPTHGFGSFCSSTQSEGTASTMGQERLTNPALTLDEEQFVSELLAGLDAYPAYYAHMGPTNLAAPSTPPDLSLPATADAAELRRRIDAGEWVVDLRARSAFARGHLPGTLNFGLDGSFATYLGWVLPWGTPVTLLGESVDQVSEAQRELVRIGVDRPAAAAAGSVLTWTAGARPATLATATFHQLAVARRTRPLVVLDVRRRLEHEDSRIAGSLHIPFHELPSRVQEIPEGQVWVHCAGAYRASIAASMLVREGRDVVAVDDDFTNAAPAGLPLESAAAA